MWSVQLEEDIKYKERIKRNFTLCIVLNLFIITYSITWLKRSLIDKIFKIKGSLKKV